LAGGCFWGVEGVFERLKGVSDVVSGYAGGSKSTASYMIVSTGTTGHAESVKITYDPNVISYGQLLKIFFAIAHDPTQLNRQGPDEGTQYRSAIFYHSEEQKRDAEAVVAQLTRDRLFSAPIVTEIVPASTFYMAEDHHQEYFRRVGAANPYCSVVIEPKVAKFRRHFVERLKR
jgi:peptide-methionine (S)-S-oxide reductase